MLINKNETEKNMGGREEENANTYGGARRSALDDEACGGNVDKVDTCTGEVAAVYVAAAVAVAVAVAVDVSHSSGSLTAWSSTPRTPRSQRSADPDAGARS